MAWIIGVDEAGYGPNLGPLTMAAVACRAPDDLVGANLWHVLNAAVCKGGADDDRLVVDDSKQVYDQSTGVGGLERGVLATLWREPRHADLNLRHFLSATCADSLDDLGGECWHLGADRVPVRSEPADLEASAQRFDSACADAGLGSWQLRGVIVPAMRFNTIAEAADSKGAVLGHAFGRLLAQYVAALDGDDAVHFYVDKHGGRNSYAAMIQNALPDAMALAEQESMLCSRYCVRGLNREVRLTFQPRADGEHFCVALASMAAKYLRERLMEEFNRFWLEQVPGLRPTAGYPGDALRFMDAIRPAARKLGLAEEAIWRKR